MRRLKNLWIVVALVLIFANPYNSIAGSKSGNPQFVKSPNQTIRLAGEVDLVHVKTSFNPILQSNDFEGESNIENQKSFVQINHAPQYFHEDVRANGAENKTSSQIPVVENEFDGSNGNPSRPPDNTLAISNSGYIVSVMNQNYRIFKADNSIQSSNISFYDALKSTFPDLTGSYTDPRVIYDPDNARFIITVLNVGSSSLSELVILFSKTANPNDGWYAYEKQGDIYNHGDFADYPVIAVSKSDLFITLRLIHSYPLLMRYTTKPVIIQIDKSGGYSGDSLNLVDYAPDSTIIGSQITLIPAPQGTGTDYGDIMYFVSNDANLPGNSKLYLYEISGKEKSGKAEMNINTSFQYHSLNYFTPAPVEEKQSSTTNFTLNPDDVDIKQAFYLDKIIHFVFSTKDQFTGYTDLVYGRLNLKTGTLTHADLGLNNSNYVYPSIASFAKSDTDKTVVIGYCRSDSAIYPEVDAVVCDNNFNFSPSIVISAGVSPIIEVGLDTGELRYGDYTGMVRQFGTLNCFFSGSYGNNTSYETTIAEIGLSLNTGVNENAIPFKNQVSVFPNPITDIFNLDFNLEQNARLNISVSDITGKVIETFYKGMSEPGPHRFSFNKASLKPGTYMLILTADGNEISSKKIVIE